MSLIFVFVFVVFLVAAPRPLLGDVPTLTDNGNASRTIIWNMTDPSGLTVQNVTMDGANATLPWQSAAMTWNRASDFGVNGTLSAALAVNASGISLWANASNSVTGGNFSSPGTQWSYTNGSSGNVVSSWNSTLQAAQLASVEGTTQTLWDGMDTNVSTNWVALPSSIGLLQNTSGMKQGGGMMGAVVLDWGPGSYAAITNRSSILKSLDWSQADRLALWIKLSANLPVGFNVTATVPGGALVGTSNVSLSKGWQELTANLDQLGNTSVRSKLTNMTLRFNGARIPNGTWFNIDDVRLGKAKDFTEQASVSQVFDKANVTTRNPGSALLAFDWKVSNATGVSGYAATVGLSGPSGAYVANLGSQISASWNHASLDVSENSSAAGAYNLSFGLWVSSNTTEPTNVTMSVDNVSLSFPDRHNGTFLSNPLTMGCDSVYVQLSWTATIPLETTVLLGMRSGNNSNPNSGAWSSWQTFSTPGTVPLGLPAAVYFQIKATIGTVNASRTPVLISLGLDTRHHVSGGWMQSDPYPALGDFLKWGTFNATTVAPPLSSVRFLVSNGTDWIPVTPGASLSFFPVAQIQWRAVLSSSDLVVSPLIHDVRISYEYTGRPVRIQVFHDGQPIHPGETVNVSAGRYAQFSATVYDAGSHILPSVLAPLIWQSNDTRGTLGQNGSYLPGSPGLHWVNVTVSGYQVYASIRVYVTGAAVLPTGASLWDLWPVYVVAIAAAVGFVVYEVVIRRMFAIDDVFLIARDGRLILHNTRRMRADRDEDILSGMLTAIMAFLRDQDPEENGELKSFEVGGKTTLLERGRHVYLSAVYSGRVPRWAGKDLHRFMSDLEARFGDAFAHWSGSPEDLHGLKDYMGRFVSRVRYRPDRSAAEAAS